MKKISTLIIVTLILQGCAGAQYRPLVDTKNVDLNTYDADLKECQEFAQGEMGAAKSAAAGATLGAIFGAVLLAALGGNNRQIGMGAAAGGISAGVSAGAAGEHNQRNVIKQCLAGRGYSVLR
jgi:hypothetical protein